MSLPTKRANRIQSPSITLPFRDPDGAVLLADVWREDILEWHPDDRMPPQFYLVLDFGVEQALAMGPEYEFDTDTGVTEAEFVYGETGRIQLDLQPIKIESPAEWNIETGEGLGPPVARFADVPSDIIGDTPGEAPTAGRPMAGWVRHPVSPRRTADAGD